jgi:hypothetical protein
MLYLALRFLFAHKRSIGKFLGDLGQAGYIGAFVAAVLTDVTLNCFALFGLGLSLTYVATKLKTA